MDLFKKIIDDQSSYLKPESSLLLADNNEQYLTEIERRQLELDKQLYELANSHRNNSKQDNLITSGYRMPDNYDESDERAKKKSLLNQRYQEEQVTMTEQEQWEQHQEKKTLAKFGTSKDPEQKQYDLLLDNQVDFVKTNILEGIIQKA